MMNLLPMLFTYSKILGRDVSIGKQKMQCCTHIKTHLMTSLSMVTYISGPFLFTKKCFTSLNEFQASTSHMPGSTKNPCPWWMHANAFYKWLHTLMLRGSSRIFWPIFFNLLLCSISNIPFTQEARVFCIPFLLTQKYG